MFNFETFVKSIQGKAGMGGQTVSPVPKNYNPAPQTPISGRYPEAYALKQKVFDFYRRQMPPSMRSTPLEDYYPVMKDMDYILAKDKIRPGAGGLGALQAFYESTGGRASSNYFGVKPAGKSGTKFGNSRQAIDYQYGPEVLGGGVANRLNILNNKRPLDRNDIIGLYRSYNPEGDYLQGLLQEFASLYQK